MNFDELKQYIPNFRLSGALMSNLFKIQNTCLYVSPTGEYDMMDKLSDRTKKGYYITCVKNVVTYKVRELISEGWHDYKLEDMFRCYDLDTNWCLNNIKSDCITIIVKASNDAMDENLVFKRKLTDSLDYDLEWVKELISIGYISADIVIAVYLNENSMLFNYTCQE